MHALIFDIDGTLTETNEVDNECFVQALEAVLGLCGIDSDWNQYPNVSDQGIVEELFRRRSGRAITEAEARVIEDQFMALLRERPGSLFGEVSGAAKFLKDLKRSNVPVAIATGCWRASALFKLEQGRIDVSDIPISSASDAVSREEIMIRARDSLLAQQECESFSKVTYFGDATWDVRASANLGWDFIGMGARLAVLQELGVANTFADFTDPDAIHLALGFERAE